MKATAVRWRQVRPGDWALHRFVDLDPRQVVSVDLDGHTVTLDILGEESQHLPGGNYDFARVEPT